MSYKLYESVTVSCMRTKGQLLHSHVCQPRTNLTEFYFKCLDISLLPINTGTVCRNQQKTLNQKHASAGKESY